MFRKSKVWICYSDFASTSESLELPQGHKVKQTLQTLCIYMN